MYLIIANPGNLYNGTPWGSAGWDICFPPAFFFFFFSSLSVHGFVFVFLLLLTFTFDVWDDQLALGFHLQPLCDYLEVFTSFIVLRAETVDTPKRTASGEQRWLILVVCVISYLSPSTPHFSFSASFNVIVRAREGKLLFSCPALHCVWI